MNFIKFTTDFQQILADVLLLIKWCIEKQHVLKLYENKSDSECRRYGKTGVSPTGGLQLQQLFLFL